MSNIQGVSSQARAVSPLPVRDPQKVVQNTAKAYEASGRQDAKTFETYVESSQDAKDTYEQSDSNASTSVTPFSLSAQDAASLVKTANRIEFVEQKFVYGDGVAKETDVRTQKALDAYARAKDV